MKNLVFVTILLFNQISYGACEKPVTYLLNGDTAKCTGFLFSPEEEAKVRDMKIKFKTMEELVVKQDELNNVLMRRIEVTSQENMYLRKANDSLESRSSTEKIIYFALGVALGVGIMKGLEK